VRPGQELHGIKPTPQTPRPPKPSSQNFKTECEHRYRILDSDIEKIYGNGKVIHLMIQATFYCEKCLDIKYIDVTKGFEE
jgi:hypothetical protein